MNINARSSMTLPAMARLFSSPTQSPEEIGSNIFLNASQGANYLQEQGRNLGIGDPVQYFQSQHAKQQMAATPSGGTMELMRLAGMHRPDSLPGQLAAREQAVNSLMQKQAIEAQGLASLQQRRTDQQYPLPTPGVAPVLSPVMQTAMAQSGQTDPSQWLMQQRLAATGNSSAVSSLPSGGVRAQDLYLEPTFQSALNTSPQRASQVFNALTGQDVGAFGKTYLAAQDSERKFGIETLRKALADGSASVDDKGNLRWRKQVADPTTGRMVQSPEFEEGNPFQKSLGKYMPLAAGSLDEFRRLEAKGDGTSNVASLQNANVNIDGQGIPSQLQAGGGVIGNTLKGMGRTVGNLFSGRLADPNFYGDVMQQAAGRPGGQNIQHVRAKLANNPRFQQLMRENPEGARRLILAMQMGDNSPISDIPVNAEREYPSYVP